MKKKCLYTLLCIFTTYVSAHELSIRVQHRARLRQLVEQRNLSATDLLEMDALLTDNPKLTNDVFSQGSGLGVLLVELQYQKDFPALQLTDIKDNVLKIIILSAQLGRYLQQHSTIKADQFSEIGTLMQQSNFVDLYPDAWVSIARQLTFTVRSKIDALDDLQRILDSSLEGEAPQIQRMKQWLQYNCDYLKARSFLEGATDDDDVQIYQGIQNLIRQFILEQDLNQKMKGTEEI